MNIYVSIFVAYTAFDSMKLRRGSTALQYSITICYNNHMNNKIYSISEIKETLNQHKKFFEEKYFVENFLLFGSYAKNQQTIDSDIDLLVNFKQPIDMFDFIDLQNSLTEIFQKKIDLGTVNSLKSFVKNSILSEAIAL